MTREAARLKLLVAGGDAPAGPDHDIVRAALPDVPSVLERDGFDALLIGPDIAWSAAIGLLRRLREGDVTLPAIILTARDRGIDRVEALDAGADDIAVATIPLAELTARLRAIVRGRAWGSVGSDTIRVGDIVVSPTKFRAWRAGRAIDLTRLELKLLAELARGADAVLTRGALLERVWGHDVAPAANLVDVQIRALRIKLTADGGHDPIATVRGVGYRLRG